MVKLNKLVVEVKIYMWLEKIKMVFKNYIVVAIMNMVN